MSTFILRALSCLALAGMLSACAGTRPAHLGNLNQTLNACPDRPNCVSSLAEKGNSHYIAPFPMPNVEEARAQLVTLIQSHPQAQLQVNSPAYLYAEFTSDWLGFVDDVEFLLSEQEGLVHVRSASRLGYSDLGVNRKRIETLREQFKP